jgi:hypothetical protein
MMLIEQEIPGSVTRKARPTPRPGPPPAKRSRLRVRWQKLRIAWRKLRLTGWTMWIAIGLAAAAATALGELSQLLADIASKGEVSYSADVFTSFTFAPAEAANEMADAFQLWCPEDGSAPCRLDYVHYYLLIDVFLFAPSLAYLLYRVMYRVGLEYLAKPTVAVLLIVDMLENWFTWAEWFELSRALSIVKWIGFVGAVAIVLGGWASKSIPGTHSWQRELGRDDKKAGSLLRTAAKLAGPIIILGLFLTLVAFPGGGPLDQLPDVLRNQVSALFEQRNPWPLVGSVFGLLLFFLALLVGASWTTYQPDPPRGVKAAPQTENILQAALVVALVVFTVEGALGVPNPLIGFVPFVLLGVLALVERSVSQVKRHAAGPGVTVETTIPPGPRPRSANWPLAGYRSCPRWPSPEAASACCGPRSSRSFSKFGRSGRGSSAPSPPLSSPSSAARSRNDSVAGCWPG